MVGVVLRRTNSCVPSWRQRDAVGKGIDATKRGHLIPWQTFERSCSRRRLATHSACLEHDLQERKETRHAQPPRSICKCRIEYTRAQVLRAAARARRK